MLYIMLGENCAKYSCDLEVNNSILSLPFVGHRYEHVMLLYPNINSNYFVASGPWHKTIWSAVISMQPIAVDTFFVLGGCLLARSILIAIEK